MDKNRNEYSIRKVSIIIFLFIMLIMLFGFFGFYIIGKNNLKNYQLFVEMNKRANKLTLMIDQCEIYANVFFNTGDQKMFAKYKQISTEIDETIDELHNVGRNEKDILIYLDKPESVKYYQEILYYLRMLKNMNRYQGELIGTIRKNIEGNEKAFKQLEYLTRYFREMDSNAKLLIQSYFNYTGTVFDTYYETSEKKGNEISLIVMFMSAIGFLFIMDYLYRLLRNIKGLEEAAKALSNRNWKIENIRSGRYREFNQVANAFNEMRHEIIHYINELEEKSKLKLQLEREKSMRAERDKMLNETKLLSLQMRMNPHFLFNTLNLIGSTAIHADIELATELIEAISDILRYNLEFDENKVLLTEEIDILKKYIFIQKARWSDRINFILENSIKSDNIKIPPMLIQPLIENSIIHGLNDTVEDGEIKIEFYEEKDTFSVSIYDNGKGISKEVVEKIYNKTLEKKVEKKDENKKRKNSIGLNNIKERLEMIYKQENLLKICKRDKGTQIVISFPLERNS